MADHEKDRGGRSAKDATTRSFEKETAGNYDAKSRELTDSDDRRSVMGAPVDPNSPTTKGNFPPGVPAQDAIDPGRKTPGAPPVDNRSGQDSDAEKRHPDD